MQNALGLTPGRAAPESVGVRTGVDEEPPPRPAFTVLPGRRVVEHTSSRLVRNRRMSKDHERSPEGAGRLSALR